MMRAPPFRQRGIALVLVIWVAVLLLVVASSFILERRSETLVVRNSASMARAEAIADAGVNRAVFEIYRIGPSAEQWKPDGTAYDWSFDGAAVKVEIRDESAKIDINTAPDLLLRGLFVSPGGAGQERGEPPHPPPQLRRCPFPQPPPWAPETQAPAPRPPPLPAP